MASAEKHKIRGLKIEEGVSPPPHFCPNGATRAYIPPSNFYTRRKDKKCSYGHKKHYPLREKRS